MQVEKDESEFLHDTHPRRRHSITDMHTGHRLAGERARHHADQEQSTAVHHASSAHMLCCPVESHERRTSLRAIGSESQKSKHDSRCGIVSSTRHMRSARVSRDGAARKWRAEILHTALGPTPLHRLRGPDSGACSASGSAVVGGASNVASRSSECLYG